MSRYVLFLAPALLFAQPARDPKTIPPMDIREYDPKSTLHVPEHMVTKAKFPFVDVHHHPRVQNAADVDQLIKDMDGINMRVLVNLSGSWGDRLKKNVDLLKGRYPNRFVVFANFTYEGVDDPAYGHKIAKQLEEDCRNGAQGVKIFKQFGMDAKDSKG